ncbi:MAG: GTP-binding protein [Oscillospiraceae bacterium]|nr:GTP-binding protein [Oscillospiraceae bacterium]
MKVDYNPCKVALLTGYLGAGKTTLLNKILAQPNGHKIAVIVNDIGEVNIDANLIAKGSTIDMTNGNLVPLTNGCICCTLSQDLAQQLSDLACTRKYDYIVIEASGICEPIPIAQTITMMGNATAEQNMPEIVNLDNIVTVVDAARFADEFSCGEVLQEEPEDEEDLASLLVQQLEFTNTVILNKADLVTDSEKERIRAVIKALSPKAEIVEAIYGDVDMGEILDTGRFDFESACMSAGWIQAIENPEEEEEGEALEYGIQTFVFETRKPFDMEKLQNVFMEWPVNVIRTKGYVWFAENPNDAFILEQAGRQVTIQPDGIWLACATEQDREEAFAQYPDLKDDWDDVYGDRVNRLVIIGQDLEKEEMTRELNSALSDKDPIG